MKKLDAFFILIVSLVLTLTGVYFYSYKAQNYFENNHELKAKMERKKNLLALQKKLNEIAKANRRSNQRNIASIANEPDEAEFVAESNADVNESAKKYFLEAKVKCYELNKEIDCMRTIEAAVTHFPESNWTGEALVLLTEFYYRTKRTAHARDVLKILKEDFKQNESIQRKVVLIERHLF